MATLIPDDEDLIPEDDGIEAVQSLQLQNLEATSGIYSWKGTNIVYLLLSLLAALFLLNVIAWQYNKRSIARFYKYKIS